MKINLKKTPHRSNPHIELYKEYMYLNKQKKDILQNNTTSLNYKLLEYNKLKEREKDIEKEIAYLLKIK